MHRETEPSQTPLSDDERALFEALEPASATDSLTHNNIDVESVERLLSLADRLRADATHTNMLAFQSPLEEGYTTFGIEIELDASSDDARILKLVHEGYDDDAIRELIEGSWQLDVYVIDPGKVEIGRFIQDEYGDFDMNGFHLFSAATPPANSPTSTHMLLEMVESLREAAQDIPDSLMKQKQEEAAAAANEHMAYPSSSLVEKSTIGTDATFNGIPVTYYEERYLMEGVGSQRAGFRSMTLQCLQTSIHYELVEDHDNGAISLNTFRLKKNGERVDLSHPEVPIEPTQLREVSELLEAS